MNAQLPRSDTGIAPLPFAIGIAVVAWIRRGPRTAGAIDGTPAPPPHAGAVKGAGEPASGLESLLYPFDPS
jgi:hypothetical protein